MTTAGSQVGDASGLRVAVHFVFPDAALVDRLSALPHTALTDHFIAYDLAGIGAGWVVKTYAYLRQAGCDVSISTVPTPHAINIIEPRAFGARNFAPDCFTLATRGDAHRSFLAHYTIEQNDLRQYPHSSHIHYWPQPGLIPRDPARGAVIRTLHFKGAAVNLDADYKDPAFAEALTARGISLVTGQDDLQAFYRDYSAVDLIFAVRNLTRFDAIGKPANKLINAWTAGVPALLGPEPAYRQLRKTPRDYIEVTTPQDVLKAIDHLQAHPDDYLAMVQNGLDRAPAFSKDAIVQDWITHLNGPVAQAFLRWQKSPMWVRRAALPFRVLAEKLSRKYYVTRARNGRRILD